MPSELEVWFPGHIDGFIVWMAVQDATTNVKQDQDLVGGVDLSLEYVKVELVTQQSVCCHGLELYEMENTTFKYFSLLLRLDIKLEYKLNQ